VNVQVKDFSAASVFPFSLSGRVVGGGEVKLVGKAGPIDAADTAMTPVEATLSVAQLDLVRTGFVEPSLGVSGLVSIEGRCSSNGRRLETSGRIKADQLKLARTGTPARRQVEFDFTVRHDLAKRAGVLSRGQIRIGKAEATLAGSYSLRGESALLNMKLAGPNMPVPELASCFRRERRSREGSLT
jgi:AsmA protein